MLNSKNLTIYTFFLAFTIFAIGLFVFFSSPIFATQYCTSEETASGRFTSRPVECGICQPSVPRPVNSSAGNFNYMYRLNYNSSENFSCSGGECTVDTVECSVTAPQPEWNTCEKWQTLEDCDPCSLPDAPTPCDYEKIMAEEYQLLVGPKAWEGMFTLDANSVILPFAGNDTEESRERYLADYVDGTIYYDTKIDPKSPEPLPNTYSDVQNYVDIPPEDPRFFSYTGIFQKLAPQTRQDLQKYEFIHRTIESDYNRSLFPIHNYTIKNWKGEDAKLMEFFSPDGTPPGQQHRRPLPPSEREGVSSWTQYLSALKEWEQLDNGKWSRLWSYVPTHSREDAPGEINPIPQSPAYVAPVVSSSNDPFTNQFASTISFSPNNKLSTQNPVSGHTNTQLSNPQPSTLLAKATNPQECAFAYAARNEEILSCNSSIPDCSDGTSCIDFIDICLNPNCSQATQEAVYNSTQEQCSCNAGDPSIISPTPTPVPCNQDSDCSDGLQCTNDTCPNPADQGGDGICSNETIPNCQEPQIAPPWVNLQLPHLTRLYESERRVRQLLRPYTPNFNTSASSQKYSTKKLSNKTKIPTIPKINFSFKNNPRIWPKIKTKSFFNLLASAIPFSPNNESRNSTSQTNLKDKRSQLTANSVLLAETPTATPTPTPTPTPDPNATPTPTPDPLGLDCNPWYIKSEAVNTRREGSNFVCDYISVGQPNQECLSNIIDLCCTNRSNTDHDFPSNTCPDFALACGLPANLMGEGLGDGRLTETISGKESPYSHTNLPSFVNLRDLGDQGTSARIMPDIILGYGETMSIRPMVNGARTYENCTGTQDIEDGGHPSPCMRAREWLFNWEKPQPILTCTAPPDANGWPNETDSKLKYGCKCTQIGEPPDRQVPIACGPTALNTVPQGSGDIRIGPGDRLCGQETYEIGYDQETFWNANAWQTNTTVPPPGIDPPGGTEEGLKTEFFGDCSAEYSENSCGAEIVCEECSCATPNQTKCNFGPTGNWKCPSDTDPDKTYESKSECEATGCSEGCYEVSECIQSKCCGPNATGLDIDGNCVGNGADVEPVNASKCCGSSAPNCGITNDSGEFETRCGIRFYGTDQNQESIIEGYDAWEDDPPKKLFYTAQREIHLATRLPYLNSIWDHLVKNKRALYRTITPYRGKLTPADNTPWYDFHDGEASGWLTVKNLGDQWSSVSTTRLPFFFPRLGGIQDATVFVRDCLTSAAVYDPVTGTTKNGCSAIDLLLQAYPVYNDDGSGGGNENPPIPGGTACTGSNFGPLPISGNPTDRPAATHPDLNLDIRGYSPSSAAPNLVDLPYTELPDANAPQLDGILNRFPTLQNPHKVNDYDWTNNTVGGPIALWDAHEIGFGTTSGDTLSVPNSGYNIGLGCEVLVLYADDHQITLKYTREDNVVRGYTLHVQNVTVDPNLLSFYNQMNTTGRSKLPALSSGQSFGTANGNEVKVVIRDTGQFMDPRSRLDWWQSY